MSYKFLKIGSVSYGIFILCFLIWHLLPVKKRVAIAQGIELACPTPLTSIGNNFDIRNPANGRMRQYFCIDSNGILTIQNGVSSSITTVNGVVRAITTKDSSGNILGIDIYPDPAITNHGASGITGNFFWALSQIPVTGGFINIHGQTVYTFNTAITDTTHVKVKITCDSWATTIVQGSSGTNIWYIGGGSFASTGWEIRDCGIIGLGSGIDTGAGIHFGASSFSNIFEHNYVFNFQGNFGGLDWSNSFNNVTDGNTFDTNNVGVELSGTNNQFGNKIINNTFLNGHGPAIQADFPYQSIITANTMINNGDFGTSAIAATGSFGSNGLMIITANMIVNPGKYCIELNQTPAGAQTVNSTITGNSCTTSGTFSIWLGTGEDNNSVTANQVNKPIFYVGSHDQVSGGTSFGSTAGQSTASACETNYAATTLATVSTITNTGLTCLPANSIIDAIVYRITTTITTAANFTIGDATIAARFCAAQSVLTVGTSGFCFAQADQTGTSGPRQTSSVAIRITTNVNPGAGAIRLIVYYHSWTTPTS